VTDSAEALIARARELAPHLREHRQQTAQRGAHSAQTDALLRDAGLYRALVPAQCGGLGLDLATFVRAVAELAQGCPATAWCVGSLAASALTITARLGAGEQAEVFEGGEARCAPLSSPPAIAAPTAGGWTIDAVRAGCVGARFATHCAGEAVTDGGERIMFVAPRGAFALSDEDGAGLLGAGAQTIALKGATIDARFAHRGGGDDSIQQTVLAAVFVGAALAAVERYEQLVRGATPDADTQRWLGAGIGRTTAAELLLLETAELHAAAPRTREDELRLAAMARESMKLAWQAVLELARIAGAQRGRFEPLARELVGGWGEPSIPAEEILLRELARERLRVEA